MPQLLVHSQGLKSEIGTNSRAVWLSSMVVVYYSLNMTEIDSILGTLLHMASPPNNI